MHQSHSYLVTWIVSLLLTTALAGPRLAAEDRGAPPATPTQEQPEVLSRGPVHEAFAEPVTLQLQAGLVAPAEPPPNIEEIPPSERPQGQPSVWIPGYWSWDAERSGYIWVSACWRMAPPRMSWVPGYWSEVPGGWEWVAGFWAPAGVRELEYLPAPPTVDDIEPRGTPPSEDTIWVPPCMYWSRGHYVRRAGYWLAAQADWVWVPSHYVVTPRGHVFAEGHWDYSLERRGMLFAPVYFPAALYAVSGFTYAPSVVIDVGLLRLSLFAYPRYSHYYFGDYYDDAYLHAGIYPWFDSGRLHTWYDPLYEHERWQHRRSEPHWVERTRDDYNHRRADQSLRPARTFREQESRVAKMPEAQRRAAQVAQPLHVAVTRGGTPLRYERITPDARQKISKQARAVRTFRDERTHWESSAARPQAVPAPQAKERRGTAAAAAGQQEAAVPAAAPREVTPVRSHPAEVSPSERVRIPASPAAGKSGVLGIFRRSPPARPTDEGRDDAARDSRKGTERERARRQGGDDRHRD